MAGRASCACRLMPSWIRFYIDKWEVQRLHFPQPWPEVWAMTDLTYWADPIACRGKPRPSERDLAALWGWSKGKAYRLITRMKLEWGEAGAKAGHLAQVETDLSEKSGAKVGHLRGTTPLKSTPTRARLTDSDTDITPIVPLGAPPLALEPSSPIRPDLPKRIWEAWRQYPEHGSARKLRKEDRGALSGRLSEGYSMDDLLTVIAWAHEDASCWYQQKGALGLYTLAKPKGFDDRLLQARRWKGAANAMDVWASLMAMPKWAKPYLQDPPARDPDNGRWHLAEDDEEHRRRRAALDAAGGWREYCDARPGSFKPRFLEAYR